MLHEMRQGFLMLTAVQVKMARVALGWGIRDLAKHASTTAQTVTKFENGGNVTVDTLRKIQAALEQAGITWVPENGGPAGVRPPRVTKQEAAK